MRGGATKARRAASWRRSRAASWPAPGEVADLVAAVVARGRRVGALLGDAHRRRPQAREPTPDGGRQADAEQGGDEQADGGGGEERRADLVDRGGDVGQLLLGDEHEVAGGVAPAETGIAAANRVERDARRDVDGLNDDDLVVGADRACLQVAIALRISLRGSWLPAVSVSEIGGSSGTELARIHGRRSAGAAEVRLLEPRLRRWRRSAADSPSSG